MKSSVMLILFLLMASVAGAQGLFGPNNNKQIRSGNLNYKKGEYDDAIKKYGEVYQKKPGDPVANFNMANALYKSGNMDSAMVHFNNAIHGTQDDMLRSKAYYNLGNAYLSKNDLQNAIKFYKESLKLNPTDENTRYNLAYALSKLPRQQQNQNKKDQKQQQGDEKQQKGNEGDDQKKENQPQNSQGSQDKNGENKMTKEMAQQLLNALNNKERETMEKTKSQSGGGTRQTDKDW